MSFDIHFLAGDRPWAESLDAMEVAAMADDAVLGPDDLERWAAVLGAVASLWPGEQESGPAFRQLNDMARGAQLTQSPGELTLSVAYWHEGEDAAAVDAWLRDVVTAVEEASGLVGFDPQSEGRFLDAAPGAAAATMDHVADRMRTVIPRTGADSPGFWRRLFRRG